MERQIRIAAFLLTSLLILIPFQNCSQIANEQSFKLTPEGQEDVLARYGDNLAQAEVSDTTGDSQDSDQSTEDDSSSGDSGSGDNDSGDSGSGDSGSGDSGSGDSGSGDSGNGDTGSGDNGSGDSGDDGEEPPPIEVVKANCENSPLLEQPVRVLFEKETRTCAWGELGNLAARNLYFQARIEKSASFSLPENSTVCDMEFEFIPERTPNGTLAQFRYDDHMILAFDNVVLASTYSFNQFEQAESFQIYDWSRLVGSEWKSNDANYEKPYCVGQADSVASCTIPKTDTWGTFSLDFSSDLIKEIVALDHERVNHNFTLVSMGDNDPDDCEHSQVEFVVNIRYVKNN